MREQRLIFRLAVLDMYMRMVGEAAASLATTTRLEMAIYRQHPQRPQSDPCYDAVRSTTLF